jgi:hypothetical protein
MVRGRSRVWSAPGWNPKLARPVLPVCFLERRQHSLKRACLTMLLVAKVSAPLQVRQATQRVLRKGLYLREPDLGTCGVLGLDGGPRRRPLHGAAAVASPRAPGHGGSAAFLPYL